MKEGTQHTAEANVALRLGFVGISSVTPVNELLSEVSFLLNKTRKSQFSAGSL